jgi:hypothetical protein
MTLQARVDKFNESATLITDHVFMMLASEDRLEVGVGVGVSQFANKPSLYQQGQGTIDRPSANPICSASEVPCQIVRPKMVLAFQRTLQDNPSGLGYPVAPAPEKTHKNVPCLGKQIFPVSG